MTNYKERLDEVLQDYSFEVRTASERGDGKRQNEADTEAKQAITSLIKELVAEAKPEVKAHPLGPVTLADCQRGLDHYEASILKALEEV